MQVYAFVEGIKHVEGKYLLRILHKLEMKVRKEGDAENGNDRNGSGAYKEIRW